MKWWSLFFAVLSLLSGGYAACRWFLASRVDFVPFEDVDGEPREVPTSDVETWIDAVRRTLKKSGGLNKEAALWTAGSLVLMGMSTVFIDPAR